MGGKIESEGGKGKVCPPALPLELMGPLLRQQEPAEDPILIQGGVVAAAANPLPLRLQDEQQQDEEAAAAAAPTLVLNGGVDSAAAAADDDDDLDEPKQVWILVLRLDRY